MAIGFPTKANWAAGDILTAAQMDDLAGTLNTVSAPLYNAAGKNKIINGDFGIWQRGISFTSIGSGNYFADRFLFLQDGTGTANATQQPFTPGNTISGYENPYFARLASTSAGTSTYMQFTTRIEDVRTYAGQTATLSFWAKSDSARTSLIYSEQNFGSGGSSSVFPGVGNASTTTTWQRFSFTVSIPSISGKTVGTSSYLAMYFRLGATTAGAYLDLWGVQLEAGSYATGFQTATGTFQGELSAAQRYFYATTGLSSNPISQASYYSSTTAYCLVPLPVPMRTTPSATFQAATNYTIYANSTNKVGSAIALDSPVSTTIATVVLTTAAATAGFAGWLASASGSANGYIQLSAEL
jgi:hypothetical protein